MDSPCDGPFARAHQARQAPYLIAFNGQRNPRRPRRRRAVGLGLRRAAHDAGLCRHRPDGRALSGLRHRFGGGAGAVMAARAPAHLGAGVGRPVAVHPGLHRLLLGSGAGHSRRRHRNAGADRRAHPAVGHAAGQARPPALAHAGARPAADGGRPFPDVACRACRRGCRRRQPPAPLRARPGPVGAGHGLLDGVFAAQRRLAAPPPRRERHRLGQLAGRGHRPGRLGAGAGPGHAPAAAHGAARLAAVCAGGAGHRLWVELAGHHLVEPGQPAPGRQPVRSAHRQRDAVCPVVFFCVGWPLAQRHAAGGSLSVHPRHPGPIKAHQ